MGVRRRGPLGGSGACLFVCGSVGLIFGCRDVCACDCVVDCEVAAECGDARFGVCERGGQCAFVGVFDLDGGDEFGVGRVD